MIKDQFAASRVERREIRAGRIQNRPHSLIRELNVRSEVEFHVIPRGIAKNHVCEESRPKIESSAVFWLWTRDPAGPAVRPKLSARHMAWKNPLAVRKSRAAIEFFQRSNLRGSQASICISAFAQKLLRMEIAFSWIRDDAVLQAILRVARGEHRIADRRNLTRDRKSTRLNSSHPSISYAVFCLKKKKKK